MSGATAIEPVARVNGLVVERRELERQLANERAAVAQQFQQDAGTEEFWGTAMKGKRPVDVARQRALAALVRRKVEQQLMLERGILSDASYSGFMQRWTDDNARREASRTVYGPRHLSEEAFFNYEHANGRRKLKALLAQHELAASESDLVAFYASTRAQYVRASVKQVTVVTFRDAPVALRQRSVKRISNDVERRATSALELLRQSSSIDELQRVYPDALVATKQYDANARWPMPDPLREIALALSVGDISGVVEVADGYAFIRCNDHSISYAPYADVREAVAHRRTEHAYELLIERLAGAAAIQVYPTFYVPSIQ